MIDLFSDVRYGLRVLSRNRSFTAVAVLALAAGIGANTAIFSMADAIVLHPFPFKDLDRIVALWETIPAVSAERHPVSSGTYFDWREQNHVFEQMAAYRRWDATLTGVQDPQRVRAYLVSPNFFSLLGIPATAGRVFRTETSEEERNQVVVSYGFWQQRLGADPNVVGRLLSLNGMSYRVAGVMAKDVDFPMYTEIWMPWIVTPEAKAERTTHDLGVIARLKSGFSLSQAQAEMKNVGMRLSREYPLSNVGRSVGVMLLRNTVDEYAGRFMAVVMGAVAFLLLLACVNVANLQLARGEVRRQEMALRLSLGATRARIARQLITEGIMLSSLGACLGLPLAVWGLTLIKANLPELVSRHVPGLRYAQLDATMLAFTLAAAVLTGIAFTVPAAVQDCAERLHETLKEGGRSSPPSGRGMRSALVISEISLAIVLLVGAGLMLKGFRNLATTKQGFDADNVFTFEAVLPEPRYQENEAVVNFYSEALRRLNGISAIQPAALISELPALADSRSSSIIIEGQPLASPDRPVLAEVRVTSADYFRAMSIPLQEGRTFTRQDSTGALPVALISKAAMRRFWPGRDALGQQVRLTSRELSTPWLTIVGIVGDVNHFFLDSEVRPTIYVPYTQQPIRSLNVVMRTAGPMDRTAAEVRATMQALDSTQPVPDIEKISRYYADLAGGVAVIAVLMGVLAIFALALAAAGIYAVMAYSVIQRTREIGIRMALGARPRDVWTLVVGNALRLVGIGLGVGLPLALALSRGMSSVLPEVIALDPFTFGGYTLLLAAIAMLASFIPTRRATKVDPLLALRSE